MAEPGGSYPVFSDRLVAPAAAGDGVPGGGLRVVGGGDLRMVRALTRVGSVKRAEFTASTCWRCGKPIKAMEWIVRTEFHWEHRDCFYEKVRISHTPEALS